MMKGNKLNEKFRVSLDGEPVTVKVVESKGSNSGCRACRFKNEKDDGTVSCIRPNGIESCVGIMREDKTYVIYKEMTCYDCSDRYNCGWFKDYDDGKSGRLPKTCEYFRERYRRED